MNALADYEYDYQFILYTSDITPEFINDFVDYLAEDREEKTSTEYKYKTKGGLKNSTINKRLDCLASLTRNYYKNHELTEMILQHKQYNEQGEVINQSRTSLPIVFVKPSADISMKTLQQMASWHLLC